MQIHNEEDRFQFDNEKRWKAATYDQTAKTYRKDQLLEALRERVLAFAEHWPWKVSGGLPTKMRDPELSFLNHHYVRIHDASNEFTLSIQDDGKVGVNWAACGETPAVQARQFSDTLAAVTKLATELQAAFDDYRK